ncbi:hypothetical protein V6N13_138228 [Hibiscus sabdariffa]|uniref:Uncharacterized protein n=1 Tax=Hibiscus sabdariffa TaxID=183260 RepID=A0ABR2QCX1_9ROSI
MKVSTEAIYQMLLFQRRERFVKMEGALRAQERLDGFHVFGYRVQEKALNEIEMKRRDRAIKRNKHAGNKNERIDIDGSSKALALGGKQVIKKLWKSLFAWRSLRRDDNS